MKILYNKKVPQKIYHTSNPIFRNKILKEGLIPKGKSDAWLSNTNIEGNVIFLSATNNKREIFDSGYDDDIYEIDTTDLKNIWYKDPNFLYFQNSVFIITYEKIPLKNIKLIYKGTGINKD